MYIPLKVTTDYTLLKSLIKVDSLIDFLVSKNINACGICDDNLSGVLEFYNKCVEKNIKPIVGLEIYINDLPIYLYAKNYEGYKNLLQIQAIKQTREITVFDFQNYKENIVVILPFKSHDLYDSLSFYKYLYVGYTTQLEKTNASILSDHTIFVNDLKVLAIEDIKYLEYLDKLRKEPKGDYSYNYYLSSNIIDEEEINSFVNLFDLVMPKTKLYIPVYNENMDSYKFLYTLAQKGLSKRLKGNVGIEYKKRLEYELDVIKSMGFIDYFLIVYDYVLYAKKNNILVGPGRGSAAGSLVSYSIGITEIDPLKYNLLFERFLNPARVTMPDIDIDFDATKRDAVIEYVKNKYGRDKVASGLTFNTLKSKLVVREVGKLLNVDAMLIDKFVREIDAFSSLKKNLEKENIKRYLNNYKVLQEVYKVSLKLEGLKKNISTHAAGVVISSEKLDEVIPVIYSDEVMLTGVTMEYLEDIGLLKMDFLGLKNLTIIANILRKVGNVIDNINLEDKKVYSLFSQGKTDGIFQFETPIMKDLMLKLKPDSFQDLIAGVALGRPGPKDHVEEFIRRKNGLEKVVYLHNDLEPILKETYGILLYQEQIMAILVKIGGYSLKDADLIRRAISKKKSSVIEESRKEFVERAIKNGYDKSLALNIYEQISKFASYGFNKSHSVAYSLIAYQMAYLKTYYPAYFIVELLNYGSTNKTNEYFSYLKLKGIKFFKPSINNKSIEYDIDGNVLIMPLSIIKNISKDIASKILEAKGEYYTDYFDFVLKTKNFMTPGILTNLIDAGALDGFKINKNTLINNMDSALNYAELVMDDANLIKKPSIVEYPEYSEDILREKEFNSYGFYITNHPSSKYIDNVIKISNVNNYLFKKGYFIVLIDSIKEIKTKKGEAMAFFLGSDETGNIDFTVFPKNFDDIKGIKAKNLVKVYGEVSKRFDKVQIIVNNINKLEG